MISMVIDRHFPIHICILLNELDLTTWLWSLWETFYIYRRFDSKKWMTTYKNNVNEVIVKVSNE